MPPTLCYSSVGRLKDVIYWFSMEWLLLLERRASCVCKPHTEVTVSRLRAFRPHTSFISHAKKPWFNQDGPLHPNADGYTLHYSPFLFYYFFNNLHRQNCTPQGWTQRALDTWPDLYLWFGWEKLGVLKWLKTQFLYQSIRYHLPDFFPQFFEDSTVFFLTEHPRSNLKF